MKTLKLITLILILSSCIQGETVYVWNIKDIIGLYLAGTIIVILSIIILVEYVKDKIRNRKKR
jgi:uncharacterized membrane protein